MRPESNHMSHKCKQALYFVWRTRVINFGFSAYLKLINLAPRPQRTAIRNRLNPSNDGGYDFHRSLRRFSKRYMVDGENIKEIIQNCNNIARVPERKSTLSGLQSLMEWRSNNPGEIISYDDVRFVDSSKLFCVGFAPDFGIKIQGKPTAVHIWNTKAPDLERRFVLGALSLMLPLYGNGNNVPADVAVLSLRDGELFRLSGSPDMTAFGTAVAAFISQLLKDETKKAGIPAGKDIPHPLTPF